LLRFYPQPYVPAHSPILSESSFSGFSSPSGMPLFPLEPPYITMSPILSSVGPFPPSARKTPPPPPLPVPTSWINGLPSQCRELVQTSLTLWSPPLLSPLLEPALEIFPHRFLVLTSLPCFQWFALSFQDTSPPSPVFGA